LTNLTKEKISPTDKNLQILTKMSTCLTDKFLITKQVISHITVLTNPAKEKNQSKRQISSNTNKDVHPSDIQISSIIEQVISHITDLTNLTKEKISLTDKNLQILTKMSTCLTDKFLNY
jgi:hypothetical protein